MNDTEHKSRRQAKEAFVVAELVNRAGPFASDDALLSAIQNVRRVMALLRDHEIEPLVTDDVRRGFFNRATWKFQNVDLTGCEVWPKMGERDWAEGLVPNVSELFRTKEPKDSRIWKMQKLGKVFASDLPIIVFVCPGKLAINDGCHRAIAMWLAGLKTTSAWIGRV